MLQLHRYTSCTQNIKSRVQEEKRKARKYISRGAVTKTRSKPDPCCAYARSTNSKSRGLLIAVCYLAKVTSCNAFISFFFVRGWSFITSKFNYRFDFREWLVHIEGSHDCFCRMIIRFPCDRFRGCISFIYAHTLIYTDCIHICVTSFVRMWTISNIYEYVYAHICTILILESLKRKSRVWRKI